MSTLTCNLQRALIPAAGIYGLAAACRRYAYGAGLVRVHRLGVPLISVGGLAMGGTGKTPVVATLALKLMDQGVRVGVVHGAYRGQRRRHAARLRSEDRFNRRIVLDYGDEAAMLAGWLPSGAVVCAGEKLAAARLAVSHGVQMLLLDDGFQHLRIHRDLDIVVHSGRAPLPLPAGPGREMSSSVAHADLLWHHDRGGESGRELLPRDVGSRFEPAVLIEPDGTAVGLPNQLAGKRVFLMAGVGNPRDFMAVVRGLGARIVGQIFVRDHAAFCSKHFRSAARSHADLLLCTEKDIVRMVGDPNASDLVALVCRTEIRAGAGVLQLALDRMVQQC